MGDDPSSGENRNGGDKRSQANWRARFFVFVTVAVLWLLWSGGLTFHHTLLLFLWPVSALFVVWLCDRLGMVNDETLPLELTLPTLRYVPWLAGQVVSASYTVLRHAWWPGARISPKTARIESETRTDVGLATFANSITLTPGTLSLEVESLHSGRKKPGEKASVLVHSLTAAGIDDLRGGAMDAQILRIEAPLRRYLEATGKATAQPGADD